MLYHHQTAKQQNRNYSLMNSTKDLEEDLEKQARFLFWSYFGHVWARIESKIIFAISILG